MPLLQITARKTGLTLPPLSGVPVQDTAPLSPEKAIAAALAALPPDAPVVVLVHGRGYAPGIPGKDPHSLIFAPHPLRPEPRFLSWPRRLGFALPGANHRVAARGLCIGFGWEGRGDIWTATRNADRAAQMLARLAQMIRRAAPGRSIDLIGHSLGARVILGAVPLLGEGALGRLFLLAGADFASRAEAALATPAGRGAEFFNITSRENDLYDLLYERSQFPLRGAPAIGRGLPGRAQNWVDIQIDNDLTRARLAALGFALPPPRLRICHWSVYLRPGIFRLYRALLHDRQRLTLAQLRSCLDHPGDGRWSRLLSPPSPRLALARSAAAGRQGDIASEVRSGRAQPSPGSCQ
ncbi:hypothetical protein [Pararhodobacter sp.]|uniref:hypothetical protein n=1 Tax=Pararhodobacter sp. TaxID=2127056 RepID=UPI002FDE93CD